MLIAALFTIAKCWKQPKCESVNEWIKKLVHLHNGMLCSRKKGGTPTLHNSIRGTGEYSHIGNIPILVGWVEEGQGGKIGITVIE